MNNAAIDINASANNKLSGESSAFALLEERISQRSAHISIVGQGYVGFPLAMEFAKGGFRVSGIDTDRNKVGKLNAGMSLTPDVDSTDLERLRTSELYEATTDYGELNDSDVIIICVPTPLRKSKDPDISFIMQATKKIAQQLRKGQLIILESTSYPGTTEELILPVFENNGLVAGEDFFLAFSPERIDPGNKEFRVNQISKVTGGVTPACTDLAALLYSQIVDKVVKVSSPKVAELAKLYENVFRSVNIALANEFALMCQNLGESSQEVITAAASKPFGFMPFYPGPGIGGHCIPVDPSYLAWKMRLNNFQARFISLAEEINQSMPGHVIQLLVDALNRQGKCLNNASILILGVAYKKDVDDIRESPALQIIANLQKQGAHISYSDPHVNELTLGEETLSSVTLSDEELGAHDCALILTDHSNVDYEQVVNQSALVVDTRNVTWHLDIDDSNVVRL